jgi:hypothetical protein
VVAGELFDQALGGLEGDRAGAGELAESAQRQRLERLARAGWSEAGGGLAGDAGEQDRGQREAAAEAFGRLLGQEEERLLALELAVLAGGRGQAGDALEVVAVDLGAAVERVGVGARVGRDQAVVVTEKLELGLEAERGGGRLAGAALAGQQDAAARGADRAGVE